MKKIISIFILSILIFSCSKDEEIEIPGNTLKVQNKEYIMPIITDDINTLNEYVNDIAKDVLISNNNDVKIIKAIMKSNENNIFSELTYKLKVNSEEEIISIDLTYKYIDGVSIQTKSEVIKYLDKNNSLYLAF